MENEKPLYHQLDIGLLFLSVILAGFSLVAVYQATSAGSGLTYVYRQMMWYGIGYGIVFASLFVDYRRLKDLAYPLYGFGLFLLILVMSPLGVDKKGAQRWIDVGFTNIQPSEFVKIFIIIIIAYLLAKYQEQHEKSIRGDMNQVLRVGVLSIIPFAFILKQPDLGTSLVIVGIVAVMLLVAGIAWRILITLMLLAVSIIAGIVFLYFVNYDWFSKIIQGHQLERIHGWLNPELYASDMSYQLLQSLNSIGSGQLIGKTLDESVFVTPQWSRIPENHTDFIFAVIGEEFGFIGASVLLSVFFLMIYRMVQISLSCNDTFGSYLVAGCIGMTVFQVFQNIGMSIGIMPITGLALPFISYGGSALLTNMIALGIVLNVAMRTKIYMFD
ncbi:rod shape-determining protein RodA [Caldalkalibacillus salinus]|uniref:rod shape-determining protein RodA n=1 Tax=Caldalkalibacillus salinus TaxID=2803787 RepID=UPI0019230386|nr:rod shape-determining protein RodA [Caldalkalibacillus salinus]